LLDELEGLGWDRVNMSIFSLKSSLTLDSSKVGHKEMIYEP